MPEHYYNERIACSLNVNILYRRDLLNKLDQKKERKKGKEEGRGEEKK